MSGGGAPSLRIEGASDLRVAVVCSQWHATITDALLDGALRGATDAGVRASVVIARVPGAFELPIAAQRLALGGFEAIAALGLVLRGDTPHFEYVCMAATKGLTDVTLSTGIPVGFGLLTCDTEEQALRAILGRLVFGVDDDSMERVVAQMLVKAGLTLAVAESLTGGLVSSRLVGVPGASAWFKGAVVSYASEVKFDMLGVAKGPVVSAAAAIAMAEGVRDRLRADVGLGVTGVAGPDEQEGHQVGTVFVGLALPGQPGEAVELRLPGDREAVRQYAAIGLLDLLRLRLSSN